MADVRSVKILLTNDDGIQAQGLHALRRALARIGGAEVSVIAPNSNRSAIARGITTREPLWVEEVAFGDGATGFATDGTPVDCVRFATLGLIEAAPELIVAGINHGANLGDDVTYSGTVAAALEGVLLGIPAIAVSQVLDRRGQSFRDTRPREAGADGGRALDFSAAATFTAGLAELAGRKRFPGGTLLNVNCPVPLDSAPCGVAVTRLGKRIYRDRLDLEVEETGRRRYRIYGQDPSYHHEPGTDFAAIAAGKVSVTPVHFDLTAEQGIDDLRDWELEALLPRGPRDDPTGDARRDPGRDPGEDATRDPFRGSGEDARRDPRRDPGEDARGGPGLDQEGKTGARP